MSAQDQAICDRIIQLSSRNHVEPLSVVALLSIHALADMDFKLLNVWIRTSDLIREILTVPEIKHA